MHKYKEKIMSGVFLLAACTSIIAVIIICLFLFANGIPAIKEIGIFKFITGTVWRPSNDIYGILPMILGSIYVTAGAILIGVPIGIFTAAFMAYFCPKKIYRVLKPAVNLLAGIPSVIYGFFGSSIYRKQYAYCVINSCRYDSSVSNRSIRNCHQSGTGKLL